MLRMATSSGVKENLSLNNTLTLILKKLIQTFLSLKDKVGKKFINRNHIEINKIIDEVKEIQDASELPLSEFRSMSKHCTTR